MKKLFSIVLCVALLMSTLAFSGCMECDHDFGSWKHEKEPTCTEKGLDKRSCKKCDEEETRDVEPYGHTEIIDPEIPATCIEDGKTSGKHCADCGVITQAPQTIAKSNHDYEKSLVKEASCDTKGTYEYKCKNCGDKYTEDFEFPTYSATDIHTMVSESVAEIITYDKNGDGLSLGSGFVYNNNIVTNYHVIEKAYSAQVTVNGKTYNATKVVAYDKNLDLAVIAINYGIDKLKSLNICTKPHNVGSAVYAIGSSKGLTDTFSSGIISNASRELDNVTYVQHTAAISNGNSGGPLINQYCEVIGVNTFTVKDSQNLNLAVAISYLPKLTTQNLTFDKFYSLECDPLSLLGDYAVENGTYGDSYEEYKVVLDTHSSEDYTHVRSYYYDPATGRIQFWYSVLDNCYLYFDIEDLSGNYKWTYLDSNENVIVGTVNPTTYTATSNLVGTDHTFDNYSLYSSGLQLATLMMRVLCNALTTDLAEIGVTAADLRFVNF